MCRRREIVECPQVGDDMRRWPRDELLQYCQEARLYAESPRSTDEQKQDAHEAANEAAWILFMRIFQQAIDAEPKLGAAIGRCYVS